MSENTEESLTHTITEVIYVIRGQRVMLDQDLAELYGVEIRVLNQAVSRNLKRFPRDFMFQLSEEETKLLRSQFVILETGRGKHRKFRPYAFTEQGVAMLSSVLRSDRAISVNIEIVRTFVKMRELLSANKELAQRIEELERKVGTHDEEIGAVFEAIKQLMLPAKQEKKERIGF